MAGKITDIFSDIPTDSTGPWMRDKSLRDDAFWPAIDIDATRWTDVYPYRLLVVEVTEDGLYSVVSSGGFSSFLNSVEGFRNGEGFSIKSSPTDSKWEFTLPITPQNITIQDQYAIDLGATGRGIAEQHNGVKFKNITISGNTGVFQTRSTIAGDLGSNGIVGSIFGGTIEKFGAVADSFNKIVAGFTGAHPSGVLSESTPSLGQAQNTGYYKALLLSEFLEKYALAKKNPENKNWRLALDIPKENQTYIVTPVSFSLNKNIQNPILHNFNLQLKAWKRISLDSFVFTANNILQRPDRNLFQNIIDTIGRVRNLLSSAINLVKAVRSDFQRVFNILRQTALAIKDISNLAFAIIDLPRQIIKDMQDTIKDVVALLKRSFKRGPNKETLGNAITGSRRSQPISSMIKSSSPANKTAAAVASILTSKGVSEGLSAAAVSQGTLGSNSANLSKIDPLNQIFDNPEEYYDLFNNIQLDSVQLTQAQADAFDDELQNIRLITVDDFRGFRNEILTLALDISNNFGAGDETFSEIYGRPVPKTRSVPMTMEENEILAGLYEMVQSYDSLIATTEWDRLRIESPLQYVGGLASENGLRFDSSSSKFLVPVPFGLTIEQLAARYLGNSDRWIEIATLNGLKSPYIDEEGFTYSILSNGSDRQLNVNDTNKALYIGQRITLRSSVVPPFVRKIVSIEKLSDTNFLITVDGQANLGNLTVADGATLTGYLPGTVNSQNQIYIPSNLPFPEDDNTRRINHLSEDNLVKISKVDFLLTEDGDIAINQLGDIRLAAGMTNLIQALKIKIRTERGTLLRHPEFGLGAKHGVSLADIRGGAIVDDLNEMIKNDPRYSRISRLDVRIDGPNMFIDMAVEVANGNGVLPITFKI